MADFCTSGTSQQAYPARPEPTVLEIEHDLVVVVRQERDGHTRLAGTTSTTDTMNVLLDCVRHLPVEYERDVWYVDTTTSLKDE